jgi:hypothetical protein
MVGNANASTRGEEDMTHAAAEQAAHDGDHQHTVAVHVNNKPVYVPAPKVTGRQIKEAAISAGLPIQLDFVLSRELKDDRSEIIGDDEDLKVNKNSRFLAIAPDDNS